MFFIHPTKQWIKEVVRQINELQLRPDESKFMIAFFSSMDNDFVKYFKNNKNQISSFSGQNFHIFTPLIYDDKVIPDDQWRSMRREFNSMGIPVNTEPTFVFFNLDKWNHNHYEPIFFAGFTCNSFSNFPNKLKNAIDSSIEIKDSYKLTNKLTEIFLTKNIIPHDIVNHELKETIRHTLPTKTIFISHSSIDKPFVKRLEQELSQDINLKFWIDENEILVGDDFQKSITKTLEKSDFLLLIISDNSTKSSWVNFEVSQFIGFANGKNIIPIIISKGEKFSEPIDNLVKRLKYLDFTEENKWVANIKELKQSLTNNQLWKEKGSR